MLSEPFTLRKKRAKKEDLYIARSDEVRGANGNLLPQVIGLLVTTADWFKKKGNPLCYINQKSVL